jgi:hypothetical protein
VMGFGERVVKELEFVFEHVVAEWRWRTHPLHLMVLIRPYLQLRAQSIHFSWFSTLVRCSSRFSELRVQLIHLHRCKVGSRILLSAACVCCGWWLLLGNLLFLVRDRVVVGEAVFGHEHLVRVTAAVLLSCSRLLSLVFLLICGVVHCNTGSGSACVVYVFFVCG